VSFLCLKVEGKVPCILILGTGWRWAASFMP
jgi:hypothetical protein